MRPARPRPRGSRRPRSRPRPRRRSRSGSGSADGRRPAAPPADRGRTGASGMTHRAEVTYAANSAEKPASRPKIRNTPMRSWLPRVVRCRSISSLARVIADEKPMQYSVPGTSLSIVLGIATSGTPWSTSTRANDSVSSPPMGTSASMPSAVEVLEHDGGQVEAVFVDAEAVGLRGRQPRREATWPSSAPGSSARCGASSRRCGRSSGCCGGPAGERSRGRARRRAGRGSGPPSRAGCR